VKRLFIEAHTNEAFTVKVHVDCVKMARSGDVGISALLVSSPFAPQMIICMHCDP
jgi:hypothetical protein